MIYPDSVMTSIFSPIDGWGEERFAPAKVTLTAQEWCGQVFHGLWLAPGRMDSRMNSYFADEGEARLWKGVPPGTLYEDALLVQLRELDGPFAGGGDWSGSLVPSLWRLRRAHEPPTPAPATIVRSATVAGNVPVTRFVLRSGDYRRTIDIEEAPPHRVLGWTTSDGEDVRLLRTARLPYWKLNHAGDESYREQLGLPASTDDARPAAPDGTIRVGR